MSCTLVFLFLVACNSGETDALDGVYSSDTAELYTNSTGTSDGDSNLDTQSSVMSTTNALISIPVEVSGDIASFLVTCSSEEGYPALEDLYAPSGERVLHWEDWYYSQNSLTEAFFFYYDENVFNWPIREEDGPLEEGTWQVVMAGLNNRGEYIDIDMNVTVQTRKDTDPDNGTVHARIVYTGGLDSDSTVVNAVELAVEGWRDIWALYGLTLEEEYATSDLDADLTSPGFNSPEYTQETAKTDGTQVTVFIGEEIDGDIHTYGVAGGIPGPLLASDRSAVVLSWLAHAGQDGAFDDDELRIFGESMAHEVGHYLGLFHPVESNYKAWDAIDDTMECSDMNTCDANLGTNLMYPYTLCGWQYCEIQETLSDGQVAVTQYYSGTL